MRKLLKLSSLCVFLIAISAGTISAQTNIELIIDAAKTEGEIDLTRYGLGQGGLSEKPMFETHVDQLAQLHPQTIRVFVQEFFDLYPDHNRYHWETLDTFIENILATGAKPILALCFKPKVLFPKIDQHIVHPTDYEEWEKLIFELVKHCNAAKKFGVEYWEISNEPDIGEDGGCPFLFQKEDYVTFYQHTAAAIQRADPKAKIGGPALAWYRSEIADALIEHCGKTNTPLNFFSWHVYHSDPKFFRTSIREVKAKLARFPKLKDCETIIDEWNMTLDKPNLDPGFQPAFVLETTLGMHEEGLSRSAYYHIRDCFVEESKFSKFMSPHGTALVANWWNIMPQYDGLWDNQGRVRPAYFSFKLLSLIRGQKISVQGTTAEVHALAAKTSAGFQIIFWNFSPTETKDSSDVTLRLANTGEGQFRLFQLNPAAPVNSLELQRQGDVSELEKTPIKTTLRPCDIRWVAISR
jgi:xylan 1,4-beta-xylosidase